MTNYAHNKYLSERRPQGLLLRHMTSGALLSGDLPPGPAPLVTGAGQRVTITTFPHQVTAFPHQVTITIAVTMTMPR